MVEVGEVGGGMTLLSLAIVGSVEAVVYQGRYRATHGTPLAAGLWTLAVCALRVLFIVFGVSAMLKGDAIAAMLAYALPAACVTGIVRAGEGKR